MFDLAADYADVWTLSYEFKAYSKTLVLKLNFPFIFYKFTSSELISSTSSTTSFPTMEESYNLSHLLPSMNSISRNGRASSMLKDFAHGTRLLVAAPFPLHWNSPNTAVLKPTQIYKFWSCFCYTPFTANSIDFFIRGCFRITSHCVIKNGLMQIITYICLSGWPQSLHPAGAIISSMSQYEYMALE